MIYIDYKYRIMTYLHDSSTLIQAFTDWQINFHFVSISTESCHPVTINVPSKIPKKSYISARNDAAAILQTIRVQQELSNGHMPAQFNGVAGSRTPDDDSLVDSQSTRDFYDTPSSSKYEHFMDLSRQIN